MSQLSPCKHLKPDFFDLNTSSLEAPRDAANGYHSPFTIALNYLEPRSDSSMVSRVVIRSRSPGAGLRVAFRFSLPCAARLRVHQFPSS